MDIILVSGLWLEASVWDDVAAKLKDHGHRPRPLALPGVDDKSPSATLQDQVDAVVAEVDASERPLVVGHSAACGLAWIVADRRPDAVKGVVLIGGIPAANGDSYADFFEIDAGVMPFPGWGPFEGADSADLDEATKERIAARAVPVPANVAKGVVQLNDKRRFDVPVTLVCPEYSPEQAQSWIDAGQVPDLPNARHVTLVDIDSGHWPMISRPGELAQVIHEAAGEA